jgi:DNA-binding transcriptional regulator WhiA
MSYASDVKKELTNLAVHRENAKAELMALIRMNGAISIANHHFIFEYSDGKIRPSRGVFTGYSNNFMTSIVN